MDATDKSAFDLHRPRYVAASDVLRNAIDSLRAISSIAYALSLVDECSPEALVELSRMARDCAERLESLQLEAEQGLEPREEDGGLDGDS